MPIWKHPSSVGKNWFTHLFDAWKLSLWFMLGAFRCFIHGLIPDIDTECAQNTASKVLMDESD